MEIDKLRLKNHQNDMKIMKNDEENLSLKLEAVVEVCWIINDEYYLCNILGNSKNFCSCVWA